MLVGAMLNICGFIFSITDTYGRSYCWLVASVKRRVGQISFSCFTFCQEFCLFVFSREHTLWLFHFLCSCHLWTNFLFVLLAVMKMSESVEWCTLCHITLLWHASLLPPRWHSVDTEIKATSAQNWQLSPIVSVKPCVGQISCACFGYCQEFCFSGV